jgi:hypothetical protein
MKEQAAMAHLDPVPDLDPDAEPEPKAEEAVDEAEDLPRLRVAGQP